MAAAISKVFLKTPTNYSINSLFISANTYERYILCKKNCVALHNNKMCFLLNCRYQIILIDDNEELLQKLDAFCFNCQHLDCLYTLFKTPFSAKIVIKNGQLFDNVHKAVHFNQQNRRVDRILTIAKKRLLMKKVQKTFVELLPKNQIEAH